MRSAVRRSYRPALLSGCSGPAAGDEGHDHAEALAEVEAPEDRYAGRAATAVRTTLLFFGCTNCPDVCPTTMADVAAALVAAAAVPNGPRGAGGLRCGGHRPRHRRRPPPGGGVV